MIKNKYIQRVVDLTDHSKNIIFNMSVEKARELLVNGNTSDIRKIDGHFALVAINGKIVRLARSLSQPLRYFIAKKEDGPILVTAERIDSICDYLKKEGLDDQFHPSYTRMAPAHYITEIALVGCPDPSPNYHRFFNPERNSLSPDIDVIGTTYIQTLYNEIVKWLLCLPVESPVGVCFSGGIDSGCIFLLTYHAMLEHGLNPSRLKAFTLMVEDGGDDLTQAHRFMEKLDLSLFLEPIMISKERISWKETISVVEDYKPLDIQAAAMTLALCRGIREQYPEWHYLISGDGGDENLKDYPIEENPELTIKSVLNNMMLYHEGWGVDAIKHSLTYSGGLSRGTARTYAPANFFGFDVFTPFILPNVIEVAEAIPFKDLTEWDHAKLYRLKGDVVSKGMKSVTGIDMPVFEKRRFQNGVSTEKIFQYLFPDNPNEYRKAFHAIYE